ncbi:MAG TPA: class IV adenylate cyclase [Candidatus Dormibacteraeota bacterium]|nr:class IV adenylate cyclase [Candidatus Dormibacteraeota bacterium]
MGARGNSVEVELKFIGADHEDVRRRLASAGARLEGPRSLETNATFDDVDESLRKSGKLLRLRDGRELTVKIPVEDEKFKSRREITAHVADGEIEELLDALGYRPTWRYEKYREGWDLDGMWVTLDEVPFVGPVVEIEGDRDRIDATAERLGLSALPTSTGNYRSLHDEYRAQHALPPGDMTFEAETQA